MKGCALLALRCSAPPLISLSLPLARTLPNPTPNNPSINPHLPPYPRPPRRLPAQGSTEELPSFNVSYKPQKIAPKFDGSVRALLHKKVRVVRPACLLPGARCVFCFRGGIFWEPLLRCRLS